MILDLHVHTIYSKDPDMPSFIDSAITFKDVVYQVKLKNLDGVAISDHNTLEGGTRFQEYVKEKNLDIIAIPAEEIRTMSGDVIGLGITEEIKPKLSLGETLDLIRDYSGISIAPHPCFFYGIGEKNLINYIPNAVETYNSNIPAKHNRKAEFIANRLNLPKVGGSDAHRVKDIGRCWTEINNCNFNLETILDSIKKGQCSAHGDNISPFETVYKQIDSLFFKLLFKSKTTYRKICELT